MTTPLRVDASAVIDLSFPIDPDHFRWRGERALTESLERGEAFTTTRFTQSAHAFTHADAPSHVLADGADLAGMDPRAWVGQAVVLDLTGTPDHSAISAADLERSAARVGLDERSDRILLLRTDWDLRRDIADAAYWSDAPWLDAGAAAWLQERGPSAVGFDFPQDEPIRRTITGEHSVPSEYVTHHALLANGIALLEYLRGMSALPARVLLIGAPIALRESDGAPARVLALRLLPADVDLSTHDPDRKSSTFA